MYSGWTSWVIADKQKPVKQVEEELLREWAKQNELNVENLSKCNKKWLEDGYEQGNYVGSSAEDIEFLRENYLSSDGVVYVQKK